MVDKKKMINRISRAEGQLRGITKMLEEERDCREVVIQLAHRTGAGRQPLVTLVSAAQSPATGICRRSAPLTGLTPIDE